MEVVHHTIDTVAAGTEVMVDETVNAVEDGVQLVLMTGNLILGLCALQVVLFVLRKLRSGELVYWISRETWRRLRGCCCRGRCVRQPVAPRTVRRSRSAGEFSSSRRNEVDRREGSRSAPLPTALASAGHGRSAIQDTAREKVEHRLVPKVPDEVLEEAKAAWGSFKNKNVDVLQERIARSICAETNCASDLLSRPYAGV